MKRGDTKGRGQTVLCWCWPGVLACYLFLSAVLPVCEAKNLKAPARGATKAVPLQGAAGDNGQAFCTRLWAKISNKWLLVDGNNQVILTAVLDAQGNPQEVTLKSNPSSPAAEASAAQAFADAKPFGNSPVFAGGKGEVKVTVTFNSKVDPHGDSSSSGQVRVEPVSH